MNPTFHHLKMSNVLLYYDSIIINSSFGEKTSLILANKVLEKGFDLVGYNFHDYFVLGVTESNGSETLKSYSIFVLRNQTQVGSICSNIHSAGGKGVGTKVKEDRTQGVPVSLIHEGL